MTACARSSSESICTTFHWRKEVYLYIFFYLGGKHFYCQLATVLLFFDHLKCCSNGFPQLCIMSCQKKKKNWLIMPGKITHLSFPRNFINVRRLWFLGRHKTHAVICHQSFLERFGSNTSLKSGHRLSVCCIRAWFTVGLMNSISQSKPEPTKLLSRRRCFQSLESRNKKSTDKMLKESRTSSGT